MSDRQVLAEYSTGLCIAGLAVAGITASPFVAALPPLAVLTAWGIDKYKSCKDRRSQNAIAKVTSSLEKSGASTRGVKAALQLLKENKSNVAISPTDLADRQTRKNFPGALYDIVFKDVIVPADDGVEGILRSCLQTAYETLRLEDEFNKIFVQESVTEISQSMDENFATTMTQLIRMEELQQEANTRLVEIQETLANLSDATREQLENLATRFEIPAAYEKSDTDLRHLLTQKATEYRALKSEVDGIEDGLKRLSNLKSAAQDAIARIDLEEVEEILSRVQEVEKEEAAKTAELRAENALLRGKVDQAYALLCDAADSFAIIDPLEPARRRILMYCEILFRHGERYGGNGMSRAEQIVRSIITEQLFEQDPWLWAAGQNAVAITLQNQGIRTDGAKGADLLADAVTAYRAALEVRTRDDHPVDWAKTQNNLGNALADQGTRTDGAKGADLLADAVTAFRDALKVRTRDDYPVKWAMTQNNLGNALGDQGTRTDGAKGADLLADAVTAFRDALKVYTRDAHPVHWAMTHENIAIALLETAAHDSCTDPASALAQALTAVDAALTVFDPEHMSYRHGTATRLRTKILAQLDART